jgi:hypothetical protein
MTTRKKLKYTIEDIKQMNTSEVNENWDEVTETLRAAGESGYDPDEEAIFDMDGEDG